MRTVVSQYTLTFRADNFVWCGAVVLFSRTGISINFFPTLNTLFLSASLVLCILSCDVSNVFVFYKHGDGRDFPPPRYGRGRCMTLPSVM
mmetsp:Transcript_94965/g.138723  ORF Transcript_94965/g.138723 Transcript_94965/m.138723 type:complete len:90 (+) Transcript_94965:152-421(+)